MFFILDLTQVGCLPVELKDKKMRLLWKGQRWKMLFLI